MIMFRLYFYDKKLNLLWKIANKFIKLYLNQRQILLYVIKWYYLFGFIGGRLLKLKKDSTRTST